MPKNKAPKFHKIPIVDETSDKNRVINAHGTVYSYMVQLKGLEASKQGRKSHFFHGKRAFSKIPVTKRIFDPKQGSKGQKGYSAPACNCDTTDWGTIDTGGSRLNMKIMTTLTMNMLTA